MPLPQSEYDRRASQRRETPAVHPHEDALAIFEALAMIRRGLDQFSTHAARLTQENSELRARLNGQQTGETEDLFRGEIKGSA